MAGTADATDGGRCAANAAGPRVRDVTWGLVVADERPEGLLIPCSLAVDLADDRGDDFAWLHGELTMVARSEQAATW